MDTITAKILVFFLSVFILIVVAHQVTLFFDDSYKTETAMNYSSAEKVTFNGIYVRNETVVTSSADGVLSYPSSDGSKIAKGSVVAYVYSSAEDIRVNRRIEMLTEEVELLQKEQSPGTTDVARPEVISGLIEEKYQTITALIAENDLDTLLQERKNLQSLLGIYQIVINKETDYNDRIDRLNSEIDTLKAKQKQPKDVVNVEDSGYFISYVDGYENILSPDNIENISADMIERIISNGGYNSSRVNKNAVGKLVDGYTWKMIGVVDPNSADFRIGNSVSVKLSSTPVPVEAEIEDLIETDDESKSIIVLGCQNLNYNLVQKRTERIELVLNDYNGIKVPRSAIRFNKLNEKGVYILQGQKVAFKKLDVIYESEDYMLSKITSDPHYISVYDDVITSGEIPAEVASIADEENEELENPDETELPKETTTAVTTSSAESASEITESEVSQTSSDTAADVSESME